jgi:hypothetical protein
VTFNNWGYQGIFPFEDDENYSPFIHTTGDLVGPSFNSPDLAKKLIQGGVAAVASLAIPYNPVGTDDIASQPLILQIFPNPAHSIVYVGSKGSGTIGYEVHSVRGERLATGLFRDQLTLDVSGFRPGAYVMIFKGKNVVETRKLIIE